MTAPSPTGVLTRQTYDPDSDLALIVDDSPYLAQQLKQELEAFGIQVLIAADVHDLPELACEADVIFVELELFGGSGFEVMRLLSFDNAAPLVLLTGTGRSTDLSWARQAGASAVLRRPVTVTRLREVFLALGWGY